jgi:RNA polymerase sigma-70 factor (ECF subfamily)
MTDLLPDGNRADGSSPGIDPDLLDRADMSGVCAGDDAAMARLVERHGPGLLRYLQRMLAHESDAADLAQETFVRLHRECRRYDSRRRLRTWLFTIAANLARNQLRWRARHAADSLDEEESGEPALIQSLPSNVPAPVDAILDTERKAAVRDAIDSLPEAMRAALLLVDMEDCSMAEASSILGIPARTVESRLFLGRRRLRDRLRGALGGTSSSCTA